MTDRTVDVGEHLPPALRASLAAAEGPAWLLDAERGMLIEGNASGLAQLGLHSGARHVHLDGAMPAVRRLRQVSAAAFSDTVGREMLLFWTHRGPQKIACDVERVPGSAVVLVRAIGSQGVEEPARRTSPLAVQADAPDRSAIDAHHVTEPPRVERNDAETLREIARRIRAAQGGAGHLPPAAPHSAPGATTAAVPAHTARVVAALVQAAEALPGQLDISKLAHELKTPLSAIVAAAEIMRDERFGSIGDPRYRGYASDIFESARHALAVITNMLPSRSGAGERSEPVVEPAQQLQFAEIDLNALVVGTVSAMRPLAEQAGLKLEIDLGERLPHVIADAVSIKQILLNLLTNAFKFSQAGGSVGVTTRYEPGELLHLVVSDGGIGMSEAVIERSLDPERPPLPSPRPQGGMGIGLPLVRKLAQANGASVAITSRVSEGTKVEIAFARDRIVPV